MQPPHGDAQAPDGPPGHPEPAPVPEPGPAPQPIPPPDPVPPPEPPAAGLTAHGDPDADRHPAPDFRWNAGEPASPTPYAREPTSPAYSGQPIPGQPIPGQPISGQPIPGYPGQPISGAPAPRRRRGLLWASVAAAVALLLCAGGGISAFLLLRNAESGEGAPDPATAVTRFLTAVYTEQDASVAAGLVCREARDQKKIAAKIDEVKAYARTYKGPRFRWDDPAVADQNAERALVSVALTMTTDDEKTAEQRLTFTVVKKTGWWVCEVAG